MKINYDLKEAVAGCAVTIGSFDGVHLGHIAILDSLKKEASNIGGESVVITFSPHPRFALGKDCETLSLLSTDKEKLYLLEKAGIDRVIILTFDKQFANQTMEEFLSSYICDTLQAKSLIVGYNHHFGKDRHSDYDDLLLLGEKYNINIVRVEKHGIDERNISSTTIRNALRSGDFDRAYKYLSHPYIFIGNTNDNGKLLLDNPKKLVPQEGQYNVKIESCDNQYNILSEVTVSENKQILLTKEFWNKKGLILHFLDKK